MTKSGQAKVRKTGKMQVFNSIHIQAMKSKFDSREIVGRDDRRRKKYTIT